jgi:hypothetical protein
MFGRSRYLVIKRVLFAVPLAWLTICSALLPSCQQLFAATTGGGSLFDNLREVVELPQMPEAGDATAKCTPVEIGQIDPAKMTGCQLTFFADLADQTDLYQFTLLPNDPSAPSEWAVKVMPSDRFRSDPAQLVAAGKLFQAPIARIFVNADRLYFQWNADNVNQCNHQLVNVILDLSLGGDTHSVRLRKQLKMNPIPLDLTNPVMHIPLPIPAWPRQDSLAVVVTDVDVATSRENFGPRFLLQNGQNQVGFKERLVLSRADAANTQISITLVKSGESEMELLVRTSYKVDGQRPAPFVAKDIKSAILRLQQSLQKGKSRLTEAQAAAPGLKRNFDALKYRPTRNAEESTAKSVELTRLKAELRRANSSIRRYGRSTPKLESALASMNEVCDVGKSLHGNVKLQIAIFAQSGPHSLNLIRFGETTKSPNSVLALLP